MLRGFSASYAGHIVEDHLGFQGTPANDRWYPNAKLAAACDWAVDFAQLLDQLGYDEFGMAAHHFQPEGYEGIPPLLMLNVYLAPQTARLQCGCGFNITPLGHPLRLAEDVAMADIPAPGPGDLRRGARLPYACSRDLWGPDAGQQRPSGTV
jgi:hypothetical protein